MISFLLVSILAGTAATAVMTLFMFAAQRLQNRQHEPLPPEKVTAGVVEKAADWDRLNRPQKKGFFYFFHFGYGVFWAMGFVVLIRWLHLPAVASGLAFGLALWALSYIGMLPAMGILLPPHRKNPRETLLMVPAHLVWGGVLGYAVRVLEAQF